MPVRSLLQPKWIIVQALAAAALWAAVALHQGYDFDWDILNYHFYNGFAVLHGKVFVNMQPAMLQTYFAPILDAAFYIAVRLLPPTMILVLVAAWESLAFPVLYRLACGLLGGSLRPRVWPWALLVTALGAAAPVSLWEAGSPRGDSTTAVFVLAALLCVTIVMPQPGTLAPARIAALAGGLIGFAVGLKLTNAPYALGLIAAFLVQFPGSRTPLARRAWLRAGAGLAAGMGITFLLCYGWWGLLLYHHLGNPVFPNFNQVFRSPYAMPTSYADPVWALPTWRDKLLFPFLRTSIFEPLDPAGIFDLRMAVALPLCALALLASPFGRTPVEPEAARARAARLAFLAFTFVSYVAWVLVFAVNRYLVALDLVAPLAAVVAVAQLRPGRAAPIAVALVLAVVLPLSAYHTRTLYWLPYDHRHGDAGGYFGVRFVPPPNLDGAVIAMTGDRPTTFVIPFFPRDTVFVRLQGSLLYPNPGFDALSASSTPEARAAVFGNAIGAAICRRLDQANGKLFLLHVATGDTPHDQAALAYFGLADAPGACTPILSKSAMTINLCPARRLPESGCQTSQAQPTTR